MKAAVRNPSSEDIASKAHPVFARHESLQDSKGSGQGSVLDSVLLLIRPESKLGRTDNHEAKLITKHIDAINQGESQEARSSEHVLAPILKARRKASACNATTVVTASQQFLRPGSEEPRHSQACTHPGGSNGRQEVTAAPRSDKDDKKARTAASTIRHGHSHNL